MNAVSYTRTSAAISASLIYVKMDESNIFYHIKIVNIKKIENDRQHLNYIYMFVDTRFITDKSSNIIGFPFSQTRTLTMCEL